MLFMRFPTIPIDLILYDLIVNMTFSRIFLFDDLYVMEEFLKKRIVSIDTRANGGRHDGTLACEAQNLVIQGFWI